MKERLTHQIIEKSKSMGGCDDPELYRPVKEPTYCDKGDHRERSIFHQPQHKEHFKKVENPYWHFITKFLLFNYVRETGTPTPSGVKDKSVKPFFWCQVMLGKATLVAWYQKGGFFMTYYNNWEPSNNTMVFTTMDGKPAIRCIECGHTTNNPMHVKLFYCSFCRQYHGKMMRKKAELLANRR